MDRVLANATPVAPAIALDAQMGDRLVTELHRLGLRYLNDGSAMQSVPMTAEVLLLNLATSPEARLRAALVPLFLWRPEYASAAVAVVDRLSDPGRATLICTYSAAVTYQQYFAGQLELLADSVSTLPDLFAARLNLPPPEDFDARLVAIAGQHAFLSGEAINWRGTYQHAIANFMRFVRPVRVCHP